MSATEHDEHSSASDLIGVLDSPELLDDFAAPSRGTGSRWLARGLAATLAAGVLIAAYFGVAGTLAGKSGGSMLTHVVKRGEMLVTITDDGTLESAHNIDIRCEVAGGTSILWIVEDGKEVQQGELLARLDSAQIEDQVNAQKITYEKARAAKIQSEKNLAVAKLAVQEYLEGTYRQESQTLDAQITIAMENLRSAENTLLYTQRMFRKGYASPLQREAQEFAVQRAKLDLETAKTAKDVLDRFTKAKTMEDLQSQLATAEAQAASDQAAFELEEARLMRLETQLSKCEIKAPRAGMVVYANQSSGSRFGSSQPQIEEGVSVREQQTIFRLPDLAAMQVKAAVHESNVDQLRRGMRARIRVQDAEYQGTVASIANQPEPTSFFSANVKEYATLVKIDGHQGGLRPGMTAEVEILIAHLKDVVTLPVAAVVEQRGEFFCWAKKGENAERRPLVLGLTNNKFIEVKDGVAEGDQVVLNPRAMIADAREEAVEGESVDVSARFGKASEDPGSSPIGPAASGPRAPGSDAERGGARSERGPEAGGATVGADAGHAEGGGPRPEGGPPGGSGRRSGFGGRMNLMDNDKDGDGKISREEAPERMADFFDRLDSNGDGFIDSAEIAAMRARSGRTGGGPPGGGGFREGEGGGGFGGPRGEADGEPRRGP